MYKLQSHTMVSMIISSILCSLLLLEQTESSKSCTNHRSEYGFALVGHVYKSFTADRLATCYSACNTQPACQSLNYNLADRTCEFNSKAKRLNPNDWVGKANSVYADNPDAAGDNSWYKLNTAQVCFGAKDNQFGRFLPAVEGYAKALKLVHISGSVSCKTGYWSYWGCGSFYGERVGVYITNSTNDILLPENSTTWYRIPGYNSNSTELVFTDFSNPLPLSTGHEIRVWYTEDFEDAGEDHNEGTSCCDVFAKFF